MFEYKFIDNYSIVHFPIPISMEKSKSRINHHHILHNLYLSLSFFEASFWRLGFFSNLEIKPFTLKYVKHILFFFIKESFWK